MENPLISVLLCTYNDEKYIAKTIKSILEQTYKNFEFLIVNDGSTDRTSSIIKSFQDNRIRLIDKKNSGLIDSLNLGIEIAKGKWIARIDGDDIAKSNRLEEQLKYIDDSVAVIGSQCEYIDEKDNIISISKLALSHEKIIDAGLNFNTMFIHPSVLINKSKLLQSEGYDPLIFAAEDLDLWLKISNFGKLININEPLLQYRMHPNKISYIKREDQIKNTIISIIKFKNGIYKNISLDKYEDVYKSFGRDLNYFFLKKISRASISKKGIVLKAFNLMTKINLKMLLHKL
jgi:glycosyltransferase involved in cell wall biosynthesis